MTWSRRGLLFTPDGSLPWARTHASTPFATTTPDGHLGVYFTSRADDNRSHIGYVEFVGDAESGFVAGTPQLVLEPGTVGLFDEAGVAMGSLVVVGGDAYLFYLGWSLRTTVPWQNTIGLAIRRAGEAAFRKVGRTPVLDRSDVDPYSMSYPWVMYNGDDWVMWYGTNRSWGADPISMDHVIRRARSADGQTWVPDGEPAVDHASAEEYAIARPSVRRTTSGYDMYFSCRTRSAPDGYRLGYASSTDGRTWTRDDDAMALVGARSSWESEMQCYAGVFEHHGQPMMLYNGNRFGATGFGLATLLD